MDGIVSPKLYATFEYRREVSTWEVPDLALFKILAEHLCQMAWARRENAEYGYEKLWIKKVERPVARRVFLKPLWPTGIHFPRKRSPCCRPHPSRAKPMTGCRAWPAGCAIFSTPKRCFSFLRHCCDNYVHHRAVPDREIRSAVNFVYGSNRGSGSRRLRLARTRIRS